jgi:hypothetical protein
MRTGPTADYVFVNGCFPLGAIGEPTPDDDERAEILSEQRIRQIVREELGRSGRPHAEPAAGTYQH